MHLGIATPQKLVSPNKNHPNGEDPLVQVGEVSFFVTQIYHSLSFIALRWFEFFDHFVGAFPFCISWAPPWWIWVSLSALDRYGMRMEMLSVGRFGQRQLVRGMFFPVKWICVCVFVCVFPWGCATHFYGMMAFSASTGALWAAKQNHWFLIRTMIRFSLWIRFSGWKTWGKVTVERENSGIL